MSWLLEHSLPLLLGSLEAVLWLKAHWFWVVLIQSMAGAGWLWSSRLKNRLARLIIRGVAFPLLIPVFFGMILAIILLRGLFEQPPEKSRPAFLTLVVLTGSLVLACFHGMSSYPAELLTRLTIPWSLTMAAVFGRGLLLSLAQPGLASSPFMVSLAAKLPARPRLLQHWRLVVVVFLVVAYLPGFVPRYARMASFKENMINKYHIALEPAQPRLLLSKSQVGDVILYENEVALLFYLTYGALHRHAVYLPYLPLPTGCKLDLDRVAFLTGWNPYLTLGLKPGKDGDPWVAYPLVLPQGATLELHLAREAQVEALEVLSLPGHLGPPGRSLSVTYQGTGGPWQKNFPLSPGAWETHALPARVAGGILALRNEGPDPIYLAGMRLWPRPRPGFNWPWEGVLRVSYQAPGFSTPNSFTIPREYSFAGRRYQMEMLHDGGASVLWGLQLR